MASPDWYLRQNPAYFHGPTVDTQRLIELGVDGIITDDPDLLVLVARRNGLR